MISEEVIKQIREIILRNIKDDARFFVFGLSVTDEKFNEIDLGIIDGNTDRNKIEKLKEYFEESLIPYKIDVINFNEVDQKFRDKILKEKIIWLT